MLLKAVLLPTLVFKSSGQAWREEVGIVWGSLERCGCLERQAWDSLDDPNNYGLPDNYGFTCQRHDELNQVWGCEGDVNSTSWCRDAWCYVDPEACSLPFEWSLDTPGMAFSYATCGHMDAFTSWSLESSLQGASLNVVYLTNSGGWKGSYCESLDSASCTGPSAHVWNHIFERAGSTVLPRTFTSSRLEDGSQPFSQQVLREALEDDPDSDSAFSACVFATGMGFVDVCIGEFTINPERRLLSNMIQLASEPVVLVTKTARNDPTIQDYIKACFRPFTPALWGTLIAVSVIMSMVIMVQESGRGGSFEGVPIPRALAFSTYEAIGSFFGVANYEPGTVGGKLTALALGILIFFVAATYTANLATMLVLESMETQDIGSIDDAVRLGQVCLSGNIDIGLRATYGISHESILALSSRSEVLPTLEDGECVAAVLKREDLDVYHAAGEFCDMVPVGEMLFGVGVGVPVSSRMQRSLTLLYARSQNAGEWDDALRSLAPASQCVHRDEDSVTLPAMSMLGPFIVSAMFLAVGVSVSLGAHWRHVRKERNGSKSSQIQQPSAAELLQREMGDMRKGLAALLDEARALRAQEPHTVQGTEATFTGACVACTGAALGCVRCAALIVPFDSGRSSVVTSI